MSTQPFCRNPSTSYSTNRIYTTHSYKKSPEIYQTPYQSRMTLSSSPARSSSPPMTPYSTRHAPTEALIRSSPEIVPDTLFNGVREHIGDSSSAWSTRYPSNGYPERAWTPLKRGNLSIYGYRSSSDFDVSEYSEDVDHDLPEVDSDHTSDSVPGRKSLFLSDTEDEENNEHDEFSFGHGGYRTTFFRTSAERGRWKSHPIPAPLPQTQRSTSIPTRLPTPVLVDSTRINSEPAPSTVTALEFSVQSDQYNDLCEADRSLPISFEKAAGDELQPETESPHTIPSLTSDWDSIPDIDLDGPEYERPSSPLPPSSPISYPISILSGSISPFSSPVMRSSSPLSETSSLDYEERHTDEVASVHMDHPDIDIKIHPLESAPTFDLDAGIKSEDLFDTVPATTTTGTTSSLKSNPLSIDGTAVPDLEHCNDPSSSFVPAPQSPDHRTKHSSSVARDEAKLTSETTVIVPPNSSMVGGRTDSMDDAHSLTCITHPEKTKPAQANFSTTQMKVEDDNNKKSAVRRKRRKGNDDDEHPVLKKHKVNAKVGKVVDLSGPTTHKSVGNEKARTQAEIDEKNPGEQVSTKSRRRRKVEVEVSCPASSTKRSKPHRPVLPKASSRSHAISVARNDDDDDRDIPVPPPTQDPETAALNAEICGMLIETMTLSRASSLPLSSLYKMIMQTQPSLRSQRSESEWLTVFSRVLQEGEAGKGTGIFGKVESSGKDNSNRPLEAQWFYVPEQDQDQERAALIRSMMPRPAKRTETKKYKQYYWRPLDKISKWDPEDEL